MRLAYFVNLYPAVSHTFIRREIRAMEALGVSITRYALRADSSCVDAQDAAEAAKTRLISKSDAWTWVTALMRQLLRGPLRFAAVVGQALRMGWRSDRGVLRHLVYVLEATVLADWCLADGITHIHAHFGTNSSAIAMFASRMSGIPYSFTAHGPEEFDNGPLLSLDEKLRFAAFAVCVSAFGRVQLMRLTPPELWGKISIVHCGLDDSFLAAATTACPDMPRIVCVGRLCAAKAQYLLVAAARLLRDDGEKFQIVLAGDGPAREEIERAIAQAHLENWISITGWVSGEQVKQELEKARALVLPSFSENKPVVIMEALALKRPVISTFIAGIPELVEPGKTGWLVPAGDERALASALRSALHTSAERLTTMGEAGRAHILHQHDALKEAHKLKGLIEKAAALKRSESRAVLGPATPQRSG